MREIQYNGQIDMLKRLATELFNASALSIKILGYFNSEILNCPRTDGSETFKIFTFLYYEQAIIANYFCF